MAENVKSIKIDNTRCKGGTEWFFRWVPWGDMKSLHSIDNVELDSTPNMIEYCEVQRKNPFLHPTFRKNRNSVAL